VSELRADPIYAESPVEEVLGPKAFSAFFNTYLRD